MLRWGGASVYLAEIAPKNLRGFYVSWQSGSQQIATIFAGAIGVFLHYVLGDLVVENWGWRIPFIIGCMVVPFIFYIRRTLEETPEFAARAHKVHKSFSAIIKNMLQNYPIIILAIMFVMMTTVTFYFITSYTPTFANKVLHFSRLDSFIITAIIGISNLFWLPVSGFISDKIGRKKVLLTMTFLGFVSAYPMLNFLVNNISFTNLVFVELWFSFIFGAYNGAMVVSLSEIMPRDVKALGFSFSYSIAVGIFGGFTPAMATLLINQTQNPASPAFWLSFAAACSLIASLILFRKNGIYEKQQKQE